MVLMLIVMFDTETGIWLVICLFHLICLGMFLITARVCEIFDRKFASKVCDSMAILSIIQLVRHCKLHVGAKSQLHAYGR